ncbi:alpha/beta fold hydrolase [Rhodococcus aerolatus]
MALDGRTIGDDGPRAVFLHGLFGQGRNFTTVARAVAERGWRVTLLDLPNHGHSPWTERVDYTDMADAVAAELEGLGARDEPVRLLGHSMGGKTAMMLALRRPELLAGLVVVDIAPVDYGGTGGTDGDEMAGYVGLMRGLDLAGLSTRADAEAALREGVPQDSTRSFLLQNLVRDTPDGGGPGWRWRLNLDVLDRDVQRLGGFPDPGGATYEGPVLWIAGTDSSYVRDEHRARMVELFPRARLVRFKGVGHWVHAQAPELFVDTVGRFLETTRP